MTNDEITPAAAAADAVVNDAVAFLVSLGIDRQQIAIALFSAACGTVAGSMSALDWATALDRGAAYLRAPASLLEH